MKNVILIWTVLLLTTLGAQAQVNMDVEGDGKISGGLTLGNTSLTTNGTIRYNGADIQARLGGTWTSLTAGGSGSSLWSTNGTGINYNSGNVGIGPIGGDPTRRLTVYSDQASKGAIYAENTDSFGYGIRSVADYISIYADCTSNGGYSYGIYSIANGATGTSESYGGYLSATTSGTGIAYGLFANASSNGGGRAYGVYSIGNIKTTTNLYVNTTTAIEDANADREVLVEGEARFIGNSDAEHVLYAEYTGTQSDKAALIGINQSADNYGIGVRGEGGYMGVRGIASTGVTGTRYGIYGEATGGERAYAVYASGDMKVTSQLFVGTSTTMEDNASSYELLVDGQAIVEELVVELSGSWPDYVFEEAYDLKPLEEVQSFISEKGHLPNVPSAATMEASDGIPVGEMQKILLEKIEELTLYTIDQENRMQVLEQQNKELRKLIELLQE